MTRLTLLILFPIFLGSCVFKADEVKLKGFDRSSSRGGSTDQPIEVGVTSIVLENDQLKVSGSELDSITSAKLGSFDLSIVSQTASELVFSSSSLINLALNTSLDLILTNAYGQSVTTVQFNLVDGSVVTSKLADNSVTTLKISDGAVTAAKLSDMSAGIGQVLKFNGTTWVPGDLSSLTYAGNWDATGNTPDLSGGGSLGEFYIVNNAGSFDLSGGTGTNSWSVGDWAVWNNVLGQWEKIDNATNVQSFNGRSGAVTAVINDYTWNQIDKTVSSIADISDVDTTGVADGKILKYQSGTWVIADDLSSGGAGSVSTSEIADGTITNADLSASAAIDYSKLNIANDEIPQAKVSGLTTLATSVGTNTSNITTNTSNISANATAIAGKEPTLSAGTTAQYYRGDKNWATLDNSAVGLSNVTNVAQMPLSYLDTTTTLGISDVLVSSQNAVKTYVDAQVGGVNASQWITSGSDIYYTTGNVGVGTTTPSAVLDIQEGVDQAITGTVSITAGTNAVTGIGSLFSTELKYGDSLSIAGEIYTVMGITDDTNLVLDKNHIAGASGVAAFKALDFFKSNNGDSDKFVFTSGGVLGVGISNPTQKLEVAGDSWSTITSTVNFTGGRYPVFLGQKARGTSGSQSIVSSGDVLNSIHAKGWDGTTWRLGAKIDFVVDGTPGASDMPGRIVFSTTDDGATLPTERMRINSLGNIGIGTSTPATKLDVNGTITATGFSGPISSSGVSASAGSAAAPSYTFSTDTNTGFYSGVADTIEVSVGGTNIFDLSGAGIASSTPGGAVITNAAGSVSNPTFSFTGDEDTGWFSPAADELAAVNGGSESIRINSSGYMGIGTTSPGGVLNISNGQVTNTPVVKVDFAGGDVGSTGSSAALIRATTNSTFRPLLSLEPSSGTGVFVSAGGNVGIGTTDPSDRLHVMRETVSNKHIGNYVSSIVEATESRLQLLSSDAGTNASALILSNAPTSGDNKHWSLHHTGPVTNLNRFDIAYGETSSTADIVNDLTPMMSILKDGNVGIGTSNPSTLLEISSANTSATAINLTNTDTGGHTYQFQSSGTTASYSAGGFSIYDQTVASHRFTITPIGHVGMGTTNPTYGDTNLLTNDWGVLTVASTPTNSAGASAITLSNQKATPAAGDRVGAVHFVNTNNGGQLYSGYIDTRLTGSGGTDGFGGELAFYTKGDNSTTTSKRMLINNAGNVGINIADPKSQLTIAHDPVLFTGSTFPGLRIESGNDQVGLGLFDADGSSATPDDKMPSITWGDNNTDPLLFARFTSGGSFTEYMRLTGVGNLGIGTTTPGAKLEIVGAAPAAQGVLRIRNTTASASNYWHVGPDGNGSGNFVVYNDAQVGAYIIYGQTAWTASSDIRLKRNIEPIENALDKINQINGVTYHYNTDEDSDPKKAGVIAQDVQKVLPEAVVENDGYLGVKYTELIPLVIEGIKSLFESGSGLKEEVEVLRKENLEMKKVLCELKPSATICSNIGDL